LRIKALRIKARAILPFKLNESAMGCVGCACGSGGCKTGVSLEDFLKKTFGETDEETDFEEPGSFNIVEVEFSSNRSDFFRNPLELNLAKGESVVVQSDGGYDLGKVKSTGKAVRRKLEIKRVQSSSPEILDIIRKASLDDQRRFEKHAQQLFDVKRFTLTKIEEFGLEMKYVDAEIRHDEQKTTIFFTAEQRVDFRELVRVLAGQFKTRIQLTQISAREEAKRVGGIGSCGRTLCCSTWLSDFEHVTADAAKYQNLPLNSTRLNGQCGRLKCCLNYELDLYLVQLKKFPPIESRVRTETGFARVEKIDIFKDEVWLRLEQQDAFLSMPLERFNALFVKR
jgi:cell fate regulator YaaT (PSP1 superfamily)